MPALTHGDFFSHLDLDTLTLLMSFCSYPTLCRLRSTCRFADELVSIEMEFRYSKGLRAFVHDPRGLRDVLDESGSVISGSFAVAIAGECRFSPADLDIYTTEDGVHLLVVYLKQRERFLVVSEGDPHIEDYSGGAKEGGFSSAPLVVGGQGSCGERLDI